MAAPIFVRVREHRERPEWLENLKQSLNHSTTFLTTSREKTEKVAEEEKLFKEKELEQLEKKIAEVEKWRDEKLAEQASTPLSEMPKLTVSMINSKIGDLESEEKKEGEGEEAPSTEPPPAGDSDAEKEPTEEKPESKDDVSESVKEGESVDSENTEHVEL